MDRIAQTQRRRDVALAIRLLIRFMAFASPLVIAFLVSEWLLWQCGETWPVSRVVRVQQESPTPVIYSRNLLSQQFGIYKLESIRRRAPQIVAVGSSRMMQFRDFMFAPLEKSFYNAGGMIQSVEDYAAFADLIFQDRVPAPEIVAVGIDPWWIKRDHERNTATWLAETDDAYQFAAHIVALRTIVTKKVHFQAFRSTLEKSLNSGSAQDTIGIAAATRDNGFRRDGSWQYSRDTISNWVRDKAFVDREKPPVVERIRRQIYQFTPPLAFDQQKALTLLEATDKLLAKGVEVWACVPPFSDESSRAIAGEPAFDDLFNGYQRMIAKLRSRGAHVVTQEMLDSFQLPDRYMIDGFHPGELYSAHMVLAMTEQSAEGSLLRQVDSALLQERLETAEMPLMFRIPHAVAPSAGQVPNDSH